MVEQPRDQRDKKPGLLASIIVTFIRSYQVVLAKTSYEYTPSKATGTTAVVAEACFDNVPSENEKGCCIFTTYISYGSRIRTCIRYYITPAPAYALHTPFYVIIVVDVPARCVMHTPFYLYW